MLITQQHREKLKELFEKKRETLYTEYHCFEDAQKAWKIYLKDNHIHALETDFPRIKTSDDVIEVTPHQPVSWEEVWNKYPETVLVLCKDYRSIYKFQASYYLIVPSELATTILTLKELPPHN